MAEPPRTDVPTVACSPVVVTLGYLCSARESAAFRLSCHGVSMLAPAPTYSSNARRLRLALSSDVPFALSSPTSVRRPTSPRSARVSGWAATTRGHLFRPIQRRTGWATSPSPSPAPSWQFRVPARHAWCS
eukprot:2523905-Prymnesium_polylepis.1